MAALTRYSNPELLNLPDCMGLLENGKCEFFNLSVCMGAGCSYYRETGSQEMSQKRLCPLDEETQEHIAQKYYGGTRPWMETANKPRR